MDLAHWIQSNRESLAQQWLAMIESRSGPWAPEHRALLETFVTVFVSLIPGSLGPLKAHVDSLWLRASELYGSVAAMRGLAAGEAVEEFQGLREVLIRALHRRPHDAGAQPLALREILLLNRLVDGGVAQASVGHTDAMFFALFQGSGLPPALTPEIVGELIEQLGAITTELSAIPME